MGYEENKDERNKTFDFARIVAYFNPDCIERRNCARKILDELFTGVPEEDRCPHLRRDSKSPYCANGLQPEGFVSDQRRIVCDSISLQLWCLDKERCSKCAYFIDNGEFKEHDSIFCDLPGR